jgi:hypothetical protein
MQITKYILPVVAGAMAGMILITVSQTKIVLAYGNEAMPDTAYMALIGVYMVCSFCAGVIATAIAQRETAIPGVVVGIVLTLAGIYNMMHISHPGWFIAGNVVAYLPFTYLGYLLIRKKTSQL